MAEETYRFATEDDVPVILELIKQLAEYEKATERVVATEEMLRTSLFERRYAEVLLAETGEQVFLEGEIDLLAADEDRKHARVVDYQTGGHADEPFA